MATPAVTLTQDREPTDAVTAETNQIPPSVPQQNQSYTENGGKLYYNKKKTGV